MKKWIAAATLALALAGCETIDGYPQPLSEGAVTPRLTASAKNRVVELRPVVFRALLQTNGSTGPKQEIRGATCTLKSPELSASLVLPAQVNIPKLKGEPGVLKLDCRANGIGFSQEFEPKTSFGGGTPVAVPGGVAGLILIAAGAAANAAVNARLAEKDEWAWFASNQMEFRVLFKGKE